MKLYRRANWFNPFYVDVNDKCYELKNIHLFNKEGIICSANRGWFGGGDNTSTGLIFDVSCVLKRKVDLTLKTAFIVSTGEKNYDNSLSAELYIPAEAVGLKEPVVKKRTDRYFVICWETQVKEVYCEAYHYVDEYLSRIENKISAVGEKISHLYGKAYEDLPRCIDVLNKLQDERIEELKRISEITNEEVLTKYKR